MTASTDPPPPPAAPESASISAIVPTFNDVGRIGDALRAIVGQTLAPAEVVVSDDGSDDATEQFVREFSEREANGVEVRYVRMDSRSGVVAARNRGIAESRGAWIACCDSDDVWAPTKLERQATFIRDWSGSRRIALLGTHGYNMNDAGKVISPAVMGPTTQEDYEAIRRAGRIFFVIHSSVMYSRADYLAVGGYTTEYGAADDFHFFCKMAELGVVLNLPEPLVYYRKRAGSVQLARFWDQQQGLLRLTENERRRAVGQAPLGSQEFAAATAAASPWLRFKRGRRIRGMYYYRLGATDMVNGRRLRGAWKLALAGLMDGRRLRAGIRGALQGRGSGTAST